MCYHPSTAALLNARNPESGNQIISFKDPALFDVPMPESYFRRIQLPCGKCIACTLKYSREWAIRCMYEAMEYERNCFVTLTLNDYALNVLHGPSLNVVFFQKFMNKLRKRFGNGIRFYHCGEYGDKFKRPHYHACIFNFDFDDRVLFKRERGVELFRSVELEKLWTYRDTGIPLGFSTVGSMTFDSAAYCARYATKKIRGKKAKDHYGGLRPEYATMSKGIGRAYFDKYSKEIYVTDSVIAKEGLEFKPPRYYDSLYEIECPGDYARVKEARVKNAVARLADNSPERLIVREKVHLAKAKLLVRSYDEGDTIYEI